MMIGDNLETDINGGKNAGIRTILFDPKNAHKNYDGLRVNKLNEIKNII